MYATIAFMSPGVSVAAATAKPTVPMSPLALRGQLVFQRNSCESCHGVGGLSGTIAASGLAGTATILPASVLQDLLKHHSIQMQKGGMPAPLRTPTARSCLKHTIRSRPISPSYPETMPSICGV
jgi:mono/diheme cytochrome c family protein